MDWFTQVEALRRGDMPLADAVYSKERLVRAEAARHPDLTPRQERVLSRDPEPLVRALIAIRPGLDPDLADALSYDPDAHVLRVVAARLDLTDGQRARLARSEDAVVQSLIGRADAAAWLDGLPFAPKPAEGRKGLFR